MKITLANIVNRIETDMGLLQKHPESKEMLEKRIAENKELIVECVLQNKHNTLLDEICTK